VIVEVLFQIALVYSSFAALFAASKNPLARAPLPLTLFFARWEVGEGL
jgi:hypothetical protein